VNENSKRSNELRYDKPLFKWSLLLFSRIESKDIEQALRLFIGLYLFGARLLAIKAQVFHRLVPFWGQAFSHQGSGFLSACTFLGPGF
jgi:hypothetical protein